jgi:large exoprotein involved in heme utilization and adhesion
VSETFGLAPSAPGIDVQTSESVVIRDGAVVLTQTFGPVEAPAISISTGALTVSDSGAIESTSLLGGGRSGAITLKGETVTMSNGGGIRTTATDGANAGNIDVDLRGTLTLSGPTTVIETRANPPVDPFAPPARGGDVTLSAENVILGDGARIRNGTEDQVPGERLSIVARDSLVISGLAGISSQAFVGNAATIDVLAGRVVIDNGFVTTSALGVGNASPIAVNAASVSLIGGAQIVSSTLIASTGSGGRITITAGDVSISGVSDGTLGNDVTFTDDASSGLFSITQGSGAAGDVSVDAGRLSIADGGKISVATSGSGAGGNINIVASGFTLTGPSSVAATTGPCDGCPINTGIGGNINVRAGTIGMTGGASITATSTGTGEALAGNINVTFGESLTMTNSRITTDSSFADGGNITIRSTGSFLHVQDSQITTSVQSGTGQGGNITIGAPANPTEFLVLTDGGIHANAFGGPGGNINLFADVFLSSTPVETAVTASSALSTPGTIGIQAQITDVSGALAQLPEGVLQAATLLRASCAARVARGRASTLVLAGREGVPPEPEGLLWSPLAEGPVHRSLSSSGDHVHDQLPTFPRVALTAKCER